MKQLSVTEKQENKGKNSIKRGNEAHLFSVLETSGSPSALRSAVSSKLVGCSIARCHLAPVITIEGGERVGRTAARARHVNFDNDRQLCGGHMRTAAVQPTILFPMRRHRAIAALSFAHNHCASGCLPSKYYPQRVLIDDDRCAHAACRNFAWRRSPDTSMQPPSSTEESARIRRKIRSD